MLVIATLTAVFATLVLSLYYLRRYFGLSLLYVFVGATQFLQTLMVLTIHVDFGDYPMSPGSAVLFGSTLLAVLLIYLREDVPTTRRLIYGVVLANVSLVGVTLLLRWGLANGLLTPHGNVEPFTDFNIAAHVFGSILLFIDALLLIFLYEAVSLRMGWMPLFGRILLSLLVTLCFDAVLFVSAIFFWSPDYENILIGNLLGKTISGIGYSAFLWAYFWYFHPNRTRASDFAPRDMTDVFSIVTYRERYIALQDQAARREREYAQERELAEKQLKEAQAELRHAQKMESIGRLAGGISHDYNNVLTAILGYAELILANPGQHERTEEFAGAIREGAQRAAKLTQQLLAFSRKQILDPQVVSPNEMVQSVGTMLERVLGENIALDIELDDAVPNVYFDALQLQQVLMNLSINGRDAMPDGGHLAISTHQRHLDQEKIGEFFRVPPGQYACISVKDSGSGMDDATQSKIFEPFFTTKEHGKGTGLGLATVYGVVEQSGGGIFVDTKVGEGSTFEVYLPATNLESEETPTYLGPIVDHSGGRILLVEDNEAVAAVTKEFLEAEGFEVLMANDGKSALNMVQKTLFEDFKPIDLLLADVIMPGMDGFELASKIVELMPSTEVILMTGYINDPKIPAHRKNSVISKPYEPRKLIHLICEKITGHGTNDSWNPD